MKRNRIKVHANESFRVNGVEVRVEDFDGKWLFLAWEEPQLRTAAADRKCIRVVREALDQWAVDASAELSPPLNDATPDNAGATRKYDTQGKPIG